MQLRTANCNRLGTWNGKSSLQKFIIDISVRGQTELERCHSHIDTGAKSRFLANK